MKQITLTDGPFEGKTYLVHETAEALDGHPALPNGQYIINGDTATWVPNKTTGTTAKTEPGTN